MKRISLIISALLYAAGLCAQPASLWVKPYNGYKTCSIVKEWTTYSIGIGAYIDTNDRCELAVVPYITTTIQPRLELDSSIDTVMDIYVVDNEVFFCGSARKGNTTVGYIGHTTVSLSGFTIADFVTFDSTAFICHLVAYNHPTSSGYKIVAVGRKPYTPEQDYGRQYIIELDHSGTAFIPTNAPAYFTVNPADHNIPENITVTDKYVAITSRSFDVNAHYFIIRCEKSHPMQTAQAYDFNDPNFVYRTSAPTIEHLYDDYVAVAYFSPVWTPYRIVVKAVDLNVMTDSYSQYFNVGIWNQAPNMAYLTALKTLVLLTSDTVATAASVDTLSYFVYDPIFGSGYGPVRTYPKIGESCISLTRLGPVHFMGHSSSYWYLQELPNSLYGPSECMDIDGISVYDFMKIPSVMHRFYEDKLFDSGSLSSSRYNYSIEISCPHTPSISESEYQDNKPTSSEN